VRLLQSTMQRAETAQHAKQQPQRHEATRNWRKVEKFKNSVIFWRNARPLCLNLATLIFFPRIMCRLWSSWLENKPLYESHWVFLLGSPRFKLLPKK
jgi:hypothetical protein